MHSTLKKRLKAVFFIYFAKCVLVVFLYNRAHLRQNLSKNLRFEVQSNFEWAILDVVKEKDAVKPVRFGKAFDEEWGKIPHSKSSLYFSWLVYKGSVTDRKSMRLRIANRNRVEIASKLSFPHL